MWRRAILILFIVLIASACSKPGEWNGEVKEFNVAVFNWGFDPDTITVDFGDKVIIHAYGVDDGIGTGHTLTISAFGINQVVRGGENKTIEFIADVKGSFPFHCAIYCGSGHGRMVGKIVVK